MRRLRDLVDSLERTSRAGSASIAKSQGLSLTDAPRVNVDNMTCEVVVCTDIVDYQQEVILASGVSVENHRKNPQIWFEHGEDELYSLTLALSEDDDGAYTVTRPDDFTIMGVSHFAKPAIQFPIVSQLFGLIDLGVIRAVSIHVQPNPGGLSTYTDRENGSKYQVTEDSHMIEYSHCKVGVNPEALKKSLRFASRYNPAVSPELIRAVELQADYASRVINSGQINNESLLPSVKKSLKAMVRTGSSITLKTGEAKNMATKKKSMTARELVCLNYRELKNIIDNQLSFEEYDSPSKARIKSMFQKVMEDNAPSEEDGEEAAPADETKTLDEQSAEETAVAPVEKAADEKPEDNAAHHSDNVGEAKAPTVAPEQVPPTEPAEPAAKPAPEPEKKPEPQSDVPRDKEGKEIPLGRAVMQEAYDAIKYLTTMIEKALGPVEKSEVNDGMEDVIGQMKALADAMDGIQTSAYGSGFNPKEKDDESDDDSEEDMDDEDEEDETSKGQLKSFLRNRKNQVEAFRCIGLVNQARRLSQSEGVSESAKKSLSYIASGFEDIINKAEKSNEESFTRQQYETLMRERDDAIAALGKATLQRDMLLEKTEMLIKEALPAS